MGGALAEFARGGPLWLGARTDQGTVQWTVTRPVAGRRKPTARGVRRIRKQSGGLFSHRTPKHACEGRVAGAGGFVAGQICQGESGRQFLTIRRYSVVYRYDAGRGAVVVLDVFGPGVNWR